MRAKFFVDLAGFVALVGTVAIVQLGGRIASSLWQERNDRIACAENLRVAQDAGYYTLVSEEITRDLDFCVSMGRLPASSLEGLSLDPTARRK